MGEDDRVLVTESGPPWEAVGKVNIGGYRIRGACTGVLVAPTLVITAAHCIMDPWKKSAFPLHDIHFLAGVRGEHNKGHSTAKCLRFLEGYELVAPKRILPTLPAQKIPISGFMKDVVAIVLTDRLSVNPASVETSVKPKPGLKLVHAAYPADRRYGLTAHFGCHVLRHDLHPPLWMTDCDTHPASSGGPVFSELDGELKVVAIMVGAGHRLSNTALPVHVWRSLLENPSCP